MAAIENIEPKTRRRKTAAESRDAKFRRLKGWFELEHMRQQANRYQMALDCDYDDGLQWKHDEAAAIRERGQDPTVHNEIKPTIAWLLGTERRTRRDFKVLPRHSRNDAGQKDAEIKTQLLKYLDDVQRAPFERSQAFDDCVKAGIGWLEIGINDMDGEEPIYCRHESWRNMLHDSIATTRFDLSDSRYLFRFKEVDLDSAIALLPEHEAKLRRASYTGHWDSPPDHEWSGAWPSARSWEQGTLEARWINTNPEAELFNARERVALVECWYREPRPSGKDGRMRMEMRVAIFTKHDLLVDEPSSYLHNKFPFVPFWCYRRKGDGMPYGVIRNLRGMQDSMNKHESKATWLLSVNQVRIEQSALNRDIMDEYELAEKSANPASVMVFANGALSGQKVQTREGFQLAEAAMRQAERYAIAIRTTSGITGENRGLSEGGASGRAILAKQDQGQMVTAEIFDNMLLAHQLEGELKLSLIEQFYTEPKVFAVTGERYKLDYYEINQPGPDGGYINDVTAHKASFVIGEAPWRQSLAAAAFENTMQMLTQLAPVAPNVVSSLLDLVFDWSDLPNKQLILQRIRAATGMDNPDAPDDPQSMQRKQQKEAMERMQFELQFAQAKAALYEAQAKGDKVSAEAMLARMDVLLKAAQAGTQLTTAPVVAPVADELARSVGFKDQAGDGALNGAVPQLPAAQPGAVTANVISDNQGA